LAHVDVIWEFSNVNRMDYKARVMCKILKIEILHCCLSECAVLSTVASACYNRPKLVKILRVTDNLLRRMLTTHCITDEQRNRILNKPTREDKNYAMIDILEQRGSMYFEEIVKCFRDSGDNNAISCVLEHDGGYCLSILYILANLNLVIIFAMNYI